MHTWESPRLLLVEDDPVIGEATKLNLERHKYDVTWVGDGLEAWEIYSEAQTQPFDLVLSDIMLPGMDGVTLCRRVREHANTPLVLLSARTDAIDIVSGLEAGADDYVTKPFDIQVLLARLRSVLRRAEPPQASGSNGREVFGDVTFDRQALQVHRQGELVALTPTEMRLFIELVDARGTVVSPRTLLSRVWDYDDWDEDSHVVTVHIQRLRAKIGAELITTVRGFGYKLAR
ncbi:MAG TPA: response regulator transcription factor [Ruania sp.]|nr:response regulator transcription factor [Ruania sp.]